jgi:hypothetical protein
MRSFLLQIFLPPDVFFVPPDAPPPCFCPGCAAELSFQSSLGLSPTVIIPKEDAKHATLLQFTSMG